MLCESSVDSEPVRLNISLDWQEAVDSMEYEGDIDEIVGDDVDEIVGDEIDEIVGDEIDEIVDENVDEIFEDFEGKQDEKGERHHGEDNNVTSDLQLESTSSNQEQFTGISSRDEDMEEGEGEDPWLDSESVADTVTSADSMSAAMHQQLMRKKLRKKLSGKDSIASTDSRFERTPHYLRSA